MSLTELTKICNQLEGAKATVRDLLDERDALVAKVRKSHTQPEITAATGITKDNLIRIMRKSKT